MKRILLIIITATLFASCAKTQETTFPGIADRAFDLWMDKNYPDAEKLPSGMYISWIERNPTARKLNEGEWAKINYDGHLLDGSTYTTRSSKKADQLGFFSYFTYYNTSYIPYYPSEIARENYPAVYNLTQGQAEALGMMRVGDSIRLYVPAKLGYTFGQFNYVEGFSSKNSSVSSRESVIIDMRLKEVVADAEVYERNRLEKYVKEELGMELSAAVVPGLYVKITDSKPTADTVSVDSMIYVNYTGRFIDGFVFDTNIEEVARNNNIYNNSTGTKYEALFFKPGAESNLKEGFWRATLKMRLGEKARVIFLSSLGYGATGDGAIPPYEPLIFDLHVLGRGED